jgi:hypothetical protein
MKTEQQINEGMKRLGKVKMPKTASLYKSKDVTNSHRFKMSRGTGRKNLDQVPDVHKTGVKPVEQASNITNFIKQLDVSNKLIDVAKKASSGIWRISKTQILNIAKKYKFNIPDEDKPIKHLGSTGIKMVRYKPNVYYLYKPHKQKYKKRKSSNFNINKA